MKFYIFWAESGRGFKSKKLKTYTDEEWESYIHLYESVKCDAEAWMDDVARHCEHVTWGFYEVPESSIEKRQFTEDCCDAWGPEVIENKMTLQYNYCPWCGRKKWKYVVLDGLEEKENKYLEQED